MPYHHPDAQRLVEQVQHEYVRIYGGRDEAPVDPAQFEPPAGLFVVAYDDGGEPAAVGGWRRHEPGGYGGLPGAAPAEIKRMYVAPSSRGRGVARAVLAHLESAARSAGVDWLVLETGQRQPAALGLYRSSGYVDVSHFGTYAKAPEAVHLGKRLWTREAAIATVVDRFGARPGHPLRVAVDGITAAGKSTLARELVDAIRGSGRPAVHVTLDGFHHRRDRRYRRGRWSPQGYYEDAYDVDAFVREVLVPLGPGGDRCYRDRVHDLGTDEPVDAPRTPLASDAVVIVDGTFLLRPEVAAHWDRVVLVDTSFPVARSRAIARDAVLFGGTAATAEAYDRRYHPACRVYLESIRPSERADVVFGNDEPAAPRLFTPSAPSSPLRE